MKWISNNEPPLYVWEGDTWYNQKEKATYTANLERMSWDYVEEGPVILEVDLYIPFPKKTRIMNSK